MDSDSDSDHGLRLRLILGLRLRFRFIQTIGSDIGMHGERLVRIWMFL
jgi:hypothetical protein